MNKKIENENETKLNICVYISKFRLPSVPILNLAAIVKTLFFSAFKVWCISCNIFRWGYILNLCCVIKIRHLILWIFYSLIEESWLQYQILYLNVLSKKYTESKNQSQVIWRANKRGIPIKKLKKVGNPDRRNKKNAG